MPQNFEPEDNVRPEDFQWQPFTANFDYVKAFYDVKLPDGSIVKWCWPNAQKMNAINGDGRKFSHLDNVQVRLSPEHPEDDAAISKDDALRRDLEEPNKRLQQRQQADRFIAMAQGAGILGGFFDRAAAMAAACISRGRSRRKYTASYRDRVKTATSHEEVSEIVREATAAGVDGGTMRKLEAAASLRHRSLNEIPTPGPVVQGYQPPMTTQISTNLS